MRRALVLTTESARHPLRAGLRPPGAPAARSGRRARARLADLRHFLLSFSACFLATLAFIA